MAHHVINHDGADTSATKVNSYDGRYTLLRRQSRKAIVDDQYVRAGSAIRASPCGDRCVVAGPARSGKAVTDARGNDPVDAIRLTASGEIDMATVDALRRPVLEAIEEADVREVLVDMAGVTFCDSSGIALFDEAYHAAVERDVRFRLVRVPSPVRRVLEIVGLLDALTAPGPR